MHGNSALRTYRIPDGVSYSLDTEISPSHPESWRKRIFGKTFSEGYRVVTGL